MIFLNDQTTNEAHSTLLARGRRQHGCDLRIEVGSRPGELEYDRSLAAAKRLDVAVAEIVAASERRPEGDWPLTHASTTSTRFPNDEVRSSGKSLRSDARPYRKGGHFVSSPLGVIDRLKPAAIEFASIGILISGFIIAALCAVDLMDMW